MTPLPRWLDAQAPSRPALVFEDERWSYGELANLARCTAGWLRRTLGLSAGMRVAWLGHNCPAQLALVFACAQARCQLLPFNWRLSCVELKEIAADATPSVLIFDDACAGLVDDALIAHCGARAIPLPSMLAAVATAAPLQDNGAAEDPLLLVYTSGTTGRAKGCVLTQAALEANARNSWHMHDMTAADTILTTLPLFHVGGMNIQTLPALACGAKVQLHSKFDPAATLAALTSDAPTLTVQVPATLQALRREPGWPDAPLHGLRAITTGSTDVPLALIEHLHERGVPVIQVYGATETSPLAIYQRIDEARDTVGAIGRAAQDTNIRLVDPEGRDVPEDTPGEILVRGPQVSTGYFRDPDTTSVVFRDGWFHSGDVASRDARGVYWFRDRVKNVIISGGENLYPAEIERVARTVAGVADCAVVGRPDPRWGAVPVLFLETTATGFDPDALQAAFQRALARFKHPAAIIEVDALPRTALGKVDLGALRARA